LLLDGNYTHSPAGRAGPGASCCYPSVFLSILTAPIEATALPGNGALT
jgi:hypothetical protein